MTTDQHCWGVYRRAINVDWCVVFVAVYAAVRHDCAWQASDNRGTTVYEWCESTRDAGKQSLHLLWTANNTGKNSFLFHKVLLLLLSCPSHNIATSGHTRLPTLWRWWGLRWSRAHQVAGSRGGGPLFAVRHSRFWLNACCQCSPHLLIVVFELSNPSA